jgi:SsrA-binding protein
MAKPAPLKDEKLIVKNRRATFDYEIDERFEAGMVLSGSEVTSSMPTCRSTVARRG